MKFLLYGGLPLLFLLYLLLIAPARSRKAQRSPFMGRAFAHRGLHTKDAIAPENSMAAFLRAKEAGFGVELDVQLSADGVVTVFHDPSLFRMTGVDRSVTDCTWEELSALHLLGGTETIPSFEAVLRAIDGAIPIIIEIKPYRPYRERVLLCEATLSLLNGYTGDFCVESFDPRILLWFRRHAPHILRGQLTKRYRAWRATHGVLPSLAMQCGWFHFLSGAQFLAYGDDRRPLCYWLFRRFGLTVRWTVTTEAEYHAVCPCYDAVIFEQFHPSLEDPPRNKGSGVRTF